MKKQAPLKKGYRVSQMMKSRNTMEEIACKVTPVVKGSIDTQKQIQSIGFSPIAEPASNEKAFLNMSSKRGFKATLKQISTTKRMPKIANVNETTSMKYNYLDNKSSLFND